MSLCVFPPSKKVFFPASEPAGRIKMKMEQMEPKTRQGSSG